MVTSARRWSVFGKSLQAYNSCMIVLNIHGGTEVVENALISELNRDFPGYDCIRQIERRSIREFMESNRTLLRGRVLDYGAGESPYRDLVEGEYIAHHHVPLSHTMQELAELDASVDCIMCNQVVQYVPRPLIMLAMFNALLKKNNSHLVMTFPTNWDEVEVEDLHRFTSSGMRKLLHAAGFSVLRCVRRAEVRIDNFRFPLGYGIVAVKS
jgi:hypothetical protein